jgi:hypothetical protein
MLHGIVTWGVVTIAVVVLVGSAVGGVLSGMTNFLAGGLQGQGSHHITANVNVNEPSGANTSSSIGDKQAAPSQSSQSNDQKLDVRESAGAAAQMTSEAAMWTLVALIIGGLAALFGGAAGLGRTRVRTTTVAT